MYWEFMLMSDPEINDERHEVRVCKHVVPPNWCCRVWRHACILGDRLSPYVRFCPYVGPAVVLQESLYGLKVGGVAIQVPDNASRPLWLQLDLLNDGIDHVVSSGCRMLALARTCPPINVVDG